MSTVAQDLEPLIVGDKLTREEFIHRWEAMPQLKNAELIGGIVYMPSPLSADHSESDTRVIQWLAHYAMHTPGSKAGNNATWYMLRDAPQPDSYLRLLRECGGSSWVQEKFLHGAPELAAEVCLSSTSYDLNQKKELYRSAGVKEYLTVILNEEEVRWHRLVGEEYQLLPVSPEGVIQSVVFRGLWLDVKAMLEGNMLRVVEVLNQGLKSPEYQEFAAYLSSRLNS